MQVLLDSVEKVKAFVSVMTKIEENIDLVSGRYIVDAKSLLGIFSLNLSKPIKVEFNGSENQQNIRQMLFAFEAK